MARSSPSESTSRAPCPDCSYPCAPDGDGPGCRCPECGHTFIPERPRTAQEVWQASTRIGLTLAFWCVAALFTMFSLRYGESVAWLGVTLFGMVALTIAVLGPAYSIMTCRRIWPHDERGRFRDANDLHWKVMAVLTACAAFVPVFGTLPLILAVIRAYRGLGV